MGCCCCCKKKDSNATSASGHAQPPPQSQPANPWQGVQPGPVTNLTITLNPNEPSVTLNWDPPTNTFNTWDVTSYDIRFKPSNRHHYDHKMVNGAVTSVHLTLEDGLEPLTRCEFEVRARNFEHVGEYTAVASFVEWHCRLPNCTRNRMIIREPCALRRNIYTFCGRPCAVECANRYCLYPGCGMLKGSERGASEAAGTDFCSDSHYKIAENEGLAAVVEISPKTNEFKSLCKRFRKDWAKVKGPCPNVEAGAILRVVNPAVSTRFEAYVQQLPKSHKKVKQYYHGTSLSCDIAEYLQLCGSPYCGVCGIASDGFNEKKIDQQRWQRFGPGFYLAPNSSKSHDYTKASVAGLKGMLLCDVAPGKVDKKKKNASELKEPTKGCNSVEGQSKFKFLRFEYGDLNYSEVVIFKADAILPRYIFVYKM